MSIADKLTTIAENQHRIYQAGYDKGKAEGGDEGWIGDGNTHIWISLAEGRTSPMLGCCPNGTVTVDWGDGTTPDVLTGTSLTTVMWTPTHNYAKSGDYVITLTVDGEIAFGGGSASGGFILQHSSSADNRSRAYLNAIYRVELGNSVTSIGACAFLYCYSLESIAISDSVTNIGNYAFQDCYSLASITIPDSVTSIGNQAFETCYGIRFCDFTNHTSVPTLGGTYAFHNAPADFEIRVPAALADEWKAATNWAAYASYIVGV